MLVQKESNKGAGPSTGTWTHAVYPGRYGGTGSLLECMMGAKGPMPSLLLLPWHCKVFSLPKKRMNELVSSPGTWVHDRQNPNGLSTVDNEK